MNIIQYMESYEHEQTVICYDKGAGLKAVIAIHDTTLGPALGGVRMWSYASEDEAITDALRLARAMTYRASVSGLNLGGGHAVVIGDPGKDKTEAMFRALGRFIASLCGKYVAMEDAGTTPEDMEYVHAETQYVVGLPAYLGGSGDPSASTAYGVLRVMEACARHVFGSGALKGRPVAVQGLGKVGSALARLLYQEGAEIIACDTNEEATKGAYRQYGATIVEPDEIYDVGCDIFSPCALGGVVSDRTIPRLKARVVAGAANNQLADDGCGQKLADRDILYAPDYVANAGGLIQLALDLEGHGAEGAKRRVARIYDTMETVIARAESDGTCTARAADRMAEERIQAVRRMKHTRSGYR
ncbi:MAG: Glu/Leu/Phe/Val dehydrogenase dimerization domain-containing protein [Chloroflexota bacterium]